MSLEQLEDLVPHIEAFDNHVMAKAATTIGIGLVQQPRFLGTLAGAYPIQTSPIGLAVRKSRLFSWTLQFIRNSPTDHVAIACVALDADRLHTPAHSRYSAGSAAREQI